jgi:hypothetical protein
MSQGLERGQEGGREGGGAVIEEVKRAKLDLLGKVTESRRMEEGGEE